MLRILKNWRARRQLKIRVESLGDGNVRVAARNYSVRAITINHVGISWPYRPEKLSARLRTWYLHGHHWPTIGWTHQRVTELYETLDLPRSMQSGETLEFEMPLSKGAFKDGGVTFVVRIRDTRGRNYYGPVMHLSH